MTADFPESETETPGIGNTTRSKRAAAKRPARKKPATIRMGTEENGDSLEKDNKMSRAGRVLNKGRRVLSRAYDNMPEMHVPRRRDFESMMEANPLILGAVGLGLGVVIGSLLPRNTIDGGMQAMGLSSKSRSGSRRGSPSRGGRSSRSGGPQRGSSSSRGRSRNGGSSRGGSDNGSS